MCGLFGIYGAPDAAACAYLGLYAQQHRGQESAGIAVLREETLHAHVGMGQVQDVFKPGVLDGLPGRAAIGHVRYSTTGSSHLMNAQPLMVDGAAGRLAVAHNGNLVNSRALKDELLRQARLFPIFQSTTDTEIILYRAAQETDVRRGIRRALSTVRGAWSLIFLSTSGLTAVRDPNGFRPLVLGRRGDAWAVASETCAFSLTGIEFVRDVEPGEMVHIDGSGLHSERLLPRAKCAPSFCVFEHVYFARPDSVVEGDTVHVVRKKLGRTLARECPAAGDVVTAIPDSGTSAGLGFAEAAGLPWETCFIRNHYVGRTFIQPSHDQRVSSVAIKLSVVRETVAGKRVVVVDDSIIRGTTSRSRMKLLRDAGAKEIHLRISCPPTRWPCYYGIDFPRRGELIAANKSVEEIRAFIGVDSLGYLSLEGMLGAVSKPPGSTCTACWTGTYAVPPEEGVDKEALER